MFGAIMFGNNFHRQSKSAISNRESRKRPRGLQRFPSELRSDPIDEFPDSDSRKVDDMDPIQSSPTRAIKRSARDTHDPIEEFPDSETQPTQDCQRRVAREPKEKRRRLEFVFSKKATNGLTTSEWSKAMIQPARGPIRFLVDSTNAQDNSSIPQETNDLIDTGRRSTSPLNCDSSNNGNAGSSDSSPSEDGAVSLRVLSQLSDENSYRKIMQLHETSSGAKIDLSQTSDDDFCCLPVEPSSILHDKNLKQLKKLNGSSRTTMWHHDSLGHSKPDDGMTEVHTRSLRRGVVR